MGVTLKPIDKDNWLDCINLQVTKEQRTFVANNTFSLLQSHYEDRNYPLAIYNDNIIVGFIMYGYDEYFNSYRLRRFMIDKNYQCQGYGKMSLIELKKLIKENYNTKEFYTSVEPQNNVAIKLYENVGFKKTGEIRWDEEVLVVNL